MILGFKTEFPWGEPTGFPEKISKRIKIHSIRDGNRWKQGNWIHYATGVRSKNYDCFYQDICTGTQEIQIIKWAHDIGTIFIDGKKLNQQEKELLAKNDGFDSLADFWKWFKKDFQGQIIHWTDYRY